MKDRIKNLENKMKGYLINHHQQDQIKVDRLPHFLCQELENHQQVV